jgi:hypothetical protein
LHSSPKRRNAQFSTPLEGLQILNEFTLLVFGETKGARPVVVRDDGREQFPAVVIRARPADVAARAGSLIGPA